MTALCRGLPGCRSAYLEGSRDVTDAGIGAIVAAWPELEVLSLKQVGVTDDGMVLLRSMQRLAELELDEVPRVTLKGARATARFPHLKRLVAPEHWRNDDFEGVIDDRGIILSWSH